MSLTLTLTGRSSVLAVSYFPAIDLTDADYKLDLTDFETYHTIPNVNFSNNKFYFDDDKKITIPEGSYELHSINDYLKRAILQDERVFKDIENDNEEYPIVLRAYTR